MQVTPTRLRSLHSLRSSILLGLRARLEIVRGKQRRIGGRDASRFILGGGDWVGCDRLQLHFRRTVGRH